MSPYPFHDLAHFLHALNDQQLQSLAEQGAAAGEPLLAELVTRFIDQEYERRFDRPRRLGPVGVSGQPDDRIRRAAVAARTLAIRLGQQPAAGLTTAESLPLSAFLDQLAVRLQDAAGPPAS